MITLTDAKQHLRITSSADDTEINDLIEQAQSILLGWLGFGDESEFYYEFGEATNLEIDRAMLMLIGNMHNIPDNDPLTDGVKRMVARFRRVGAR